MIQPKHQAIIPVDLVNNFPREKGEDYYCSEAKVLAPGVYSSHTLLPGNKYTGLAVRVLNTTSGLIRLLVGCDLGELSLIQTTDAKSPNEIDSGFIKLPDALTPKQHAQAVSFLAQYNDLMYMTNLDIGRTHLIEHEIDTGNVRLICQPLCCIQ